MAIEVFRTREHGAGTEGTTSEREGVYRVLGTTDGATAGAAALIEANTEFLDLIPGDVKWDPYNNCVDVWTVKIPFREFKPKPPNQQNRPVGSKKITYNISGGTQNVKKSLQTVTSKKSASKLSTLRDFKNAINVDNDGKAQGTDIFIPATSFDIEFNCPNATAGQAYFDMVESLVGRTNAEQFETDDGRIFINREPGEVLFVGFSCTEQNDDALIFSFKYLAQQNQTGLVIGDIPAVDKKGWEYLWLRFQDISQSSQFVTIPWEVFIERLYEPGNLLSVF